MKLLLQNNPVYAKDCKPPRRIGSETVYPLADELTIANIKVKRNGKSRLLTDYLRQMLHKGIEREMDAISIFGTGGEEPKWNIETFIANQSDETI